MAAKREQIFWSGLWEVAEKLENSYGSLIAVCSGALLVFSELSGDEREAAVERARGLQVPLQSPGEKAAVDEAAAARDAKAIRRKAGRRAPAKVE